MLAASGDTNTDAGVSLIDLRNCSRDLPRSKVYPRKTIAGVARTTVKTAIRPRDTPVFVVRAPTESGLSE